MTSAVTSLREPTELVPVEQGTLKALVSNPEVSSTAPSIQDKEQAVVSPLTHLLEIVQNSNLPASEKNIAFVQALTKTTLAAFKNSTLADEFCINNFSFKVSTSPNDMKATSETDARLANSSFPIFVTQSQKEVVFSAIELPKALQDEMNKDSLLKEKAKVETIRTLQELIQGTALRYKSVQIEGEIPALSTHQYSLVTFVPVTTTGEETSASWTPFFKSAPNLKLMVTYGNVCDVQDARGGAGAYRTSPYFTPIFDSPVTCRGWTSKAFSAQDTQESAAQKVQNSAMRLAIIPLKTVENKKSYQIETDRTTALEICAIPIDVSQLSNEENLEQYLQVIGGIFKKVACLEVEQDKSTKQKESAEAAPEQKESAIPQASNQAPQNPEKPSEGVLESVKAKAQDVVNQAQEVAKQASEQLNKQVEWHKKFWGQLFTQNK